MRNISIFTVSVIISLCSVGILIAQEIESDPDATPDIMPDSLISDTSAAAIDTIFVPPDSMALILAGTYTVGYKKGISDQRPEHEVEIDSFYLDIHEVTNAQYGVFLDSTGYRQPLFWDDSTLNEPHQPVTGVSWYDAVAYCEWAGKRLPTEAEWEIAARGGLTGEEYPWNGRASEDKANYRYDETMTDGGVREVGQYPPNGYGLYDMAGNVWEWTADYYSPSIYADSTRWTNPRGPGKGTAKALRGGSWNYTKEFITVHCRNRLEPSARMNFIGFRCAKDCD